MLRIGSPLILALLLLSAPVQAQVAESATGGGHALWVGGSYADFHADFGGSARVRGLGAYSTFNWNYRWGVEVRASFLDSSNFHNEAESFYLAGPRYSALRHGRIRPFAALLLGAGHIRYPFEIGSGTYLAYAPSGGVDFRVSHKLQARAEYSYQLWPSAPGFSGEPSHGLKPNGVSVGVAYRIF